MEKKKKKQHNVLAEATLQLGQEKLGRDDDVLEDGEVTAEAVAGAELRQHQVHLVHTGGGGQSDETDVFTVATV